MKLEGVTATYARGRGTPHGGANTAAPAADPGIASAVAAATAHRMAQLRQQYEAETLASGRTAPDAGAVVAAAVLQIETARATEDAIRRLRDEAAARVLAEAKSAADYRAFLRQREVEARMGRR